MRLITTLALVIVVSACAGKSDNASPLSPNEALAPSAGQHAQVSAEALAFPLLAGSFTITDREGDGIAGSYRGTSRLPGDGSQRASVTLQIANGTGKFSGAIGSLTLSGVGAFADEGSFLLEGHGEVALAGGKRAKVVLNLRGRSAVSACSISERIVISQTATGAMGHAGRVTATLSHEVGNTGCFP